MTTERLCKWLETEASESVKRTVPMGEVIEIWQAARRATREECAVLVEGLSGVLDVHDMHNAGEEYTSEEGTLRNIAAAIRALAQENGG